MGQFLLGAAERLLQELTDVVPVINSKRYEKRTIEGPMEKGPKKKVPWRACKPRRQLLRGKNEHEVESYFLGKRILSSLD